MSAWDARRAKVVAVVRAEEIEIIRVVLARARLRELVAMMMLVLMMAVAKKVNNNM